MASESKTSSAADLPAAAIGAELTPEFFEAASASFRSDPKNILARNAVTAAGIGKVRLNSAVTSLASHTYSTKVPTEGTITNQKASGRCWLFAALNVLRLELIEKYKLPKSFELSQTFLFYWDKIERSNFFLEQVLDTTDEDVGSRVVQYLLSAPVNDGGQWDMIVNIIQRHGVVPKSVYPDSVTSTASRYMNADLTTLLREYACELRKMKADGASDDDLRKRKADMMIVIHRIVNIHLGEVPTKFDWSFHDSDGKHTVMRDMTPMTFYANVGVNVSDYRSLVNDPRNPYNTLMTVDRLGNTVGGVPVRYINVSADIMKAKARAVIESGKPVWFGCDVGKHLDRDLGIMDLDIIDYEAVYSTKPTLSKKDRLLYGQSLMTHAMVFTGFDVDAADATSKWRVENSWGDSSGDKGYYQMTDSWFSEYCYQVVVHKDFLGDELGSVLESTPIVLPPWDPMGSLASKPAFAADAPADSEARL